jgi:hypothetical protein
VMGASRWLEAKSRAGGATSSVSIADSGNNDRSFVFMRKILPSWWNFSFRWNYDDRGILD